MKFDLNKNDLRILRLIHRYSQDKRVKLYLVGGYLRDIMLKRSRNSPDIDFAIKNNAIKFAAGLAKHLKAGFVVLDKENGCARLVKRTKDRIYTLDFTDFRGKDILQDLNKRDFSINTLAIELSVFLDSPGFGFLDPYSGLRDLKDKVIRIVNSRAFDDDPLRILRAFSLSCILNFRIEPKVLRLVSKKRNKLKKVSFERVRDELFKILSSPKGYECFVQLEKYGIINLIFPEIRAMHRLNQGPYHHLDVYKHTQETLRQLEKIIQNSLRNQDLKQYLNEEVSSGHRRYELIKLGAFLHDIGKPKTLRIEDGKVKFHGHERVGTYILQDIAERLRLSNCEISVLKKMVLFHLRPGYLADIPKISQRARYRFFRDAGTEAVSVLLISLADQRATKGVLTTKESRRRHERVVRSLIKEYFKKGKEQKQARLINGHDLIRRFKLEPSPLIGQLLSQIEEAQAIGKIKTKQEAFNIVEKVFANKQIRKKSKDKRGGR